VPKCVTGGALVYPPVSNATSEGFWVALRPGSYLPGPHGCLRYLGVFQITLDVKAFELRLQVTRVKLLVK